MEVVESIDQQPLSVHIWTRDKEEKLDLINLGVLIVLEKLGYFQKIVSDSNWPAFEPTDKRSEENKELIIKQGIVEYFKDYTW